MSHEPSTASDQIMVRPTSVRHLVLTVTTVMSILLYLDRFAVGIAAEYIRTDLQMTQTQMAWFVSAFFWSYALCQVPAGWLSDRFGARVMLTIYILGWSAFTGLMGAAHIAVLMLWLRLLCGMTQAGAYPTSAALIRQWYSLSARGTASSMVGLGGRFGAVLAPIATAWLIKEAGWRSAVALYGVAGIAVAVVFAWVIRNSPRQHAWCNAAERKTVQTGTSEVSPVSEATHAPFPWQSFLFSTSLWGNSLTQFFTNFGWFFVVSSLPRYLDRVHQVPLVMQGYMTAFPSFLGIIGLFLGGRCTDWAIRSLGLKWGRRAPLALSRLTAAGGYGLCLLLGLLIEPGPDKTWLPWLFIVGLCIAAASTDFGTPAIWAYAQDVGGQYTASILGWANMWGNLGAAVAPLIYNFCLGESPTIENWNRVFAMCAGAFVLSALTSMVLDSTKPLTIEQQ